VRSSADLTESSDFRRNLPRFSGEALEANQAVVDAIRAVADEREATAAQVALAWLRYRADEFGVAAVPIPGTRRAARVEENLGSLDVALDDDQLARLDAAAAAVTGHRIADLTWVSAGRE
jgi:aryl-alcohol dehydrogenase-like predicted oxidoreductase